MDNNTQIPNPTNRSRAGSCVTTNLPRIVTTIVQTKTTKLALARITPAGLACIDLNNCPLTNQLKLVVNPQCGQLTPVMDRKVHGGKPSCWCVPNPLESGLRQRAMPNTTTIPTPSNSVNTRCLRLKARRICELDSDIAGERYQSAIEFTRGMMSLNLVKKSSPAAIATCSNSSEPVVCRSCRKASLAGDLC